MDSAIWAIAYDLKSEGQAEYLDWFHSVHIPEKLARPGYVWAAHYRIVAADRTARAGAPRSDSYLALFAGASSRVFFDPTLSELKARQDDLTRRMMGCRSGAQAFILAEEWRQETAGGPAWPVVDLQVLDAAGAEEDVGAWCVKELAALAARPSGASGLRKLLVSQGPARHAIMLGFGNLDARDEFAGSAALGKTAEALAPRLHPHPRSPIVGVRVWPQ